MTFNSGQAYGHHMRSVHKETVLYKCKECKKSCKTSQELVRHEITHTKDKPFVCSMCSYPFNKKWNLTVHQRNCPKAPDYVNKRKRSEKNKFETDINQFVENYAQYNGLRCSVPDMLKKSETFFCKDVKFNGKICNTLK